MASDPLSAWRTEFDPILNQVYYVNSVDGSVSFDSPCEVQSGPKRNSHGGVFAKISSKMSLIRSKSSQSYNSCPLFGAVPLSQSSSQTSESNSEHLEKTTEKMEVTPEHKEESPENMEVTPQNGQGLVAPPASLNDDAFSLDSSMEYSDSDSFPANSYLLERAFNIHDHDDMMSIDSDESIQSFHEELPRSEIYYDYESSVYVDRHALPYLDFDREQERYELRQQIMQELY